MKPPTNAQIDELLMSVITPNWQKVAMVIAKALHMLEDKGMEIGAQAVAARIVSLSSDGRIESQGNLSNWRHSEVRFPAAQLKRSP
jgi:Protein of unknown function